jgi:hypothetical protein
MSDSTQQILSKALYKMLRPLVRLLLRHGICYRLFADIARHAYVDAAMEDFAIPSRKPSFSRVAVLTGINRKDIAKLKERPHPLDGAGNNRNPSAQVIDAWIADARFHDSQGRPAVLPIDGGPVDFTQLVNDYSTDLPVRALLDELLRIGAVERVGEGVRLLTPAYIPYEDVEEKIRIMGTAAKDLLTTLDYNLSRHGPGTYLQRTVSFNNIPVELLERIRSRSHAEGEDFLLKMNEWLAQYDRDNNTDLVGSGRVRAGIGIYYFEHSLNEDGGDRTPSDREG